MLNEIIRDYGYHKNLDAYHPDYVAAWEIAEYVPWLIKEVNKLKVELDAAHAALRTLVDAIPCSCHTHLYESIDCVSCSIARHEIGMAQNLLGESTENPLMPELCGPIMKRPRVVAEWEEE